MLQEHPLDRTMRRLRVPIFVVSLLASPVMLYSYGWMMMRSYEWMPGWAFAATFIAHLIGWVSIGCLIDSLSERRTARGLGR